MIFESNFLEDEISCKRIYSALSSRYRSFVQAPSSSYNAIISIIIRKKTPGVVRTKKSKLLLVALKKIFKQQPTKCRIGNSRQGYERSKSGWIVGRKIQTTDAREEEFLAREDFRPESFRSFELSSFPLILCLQRLPRYR